MSIPDVTARIIIDDELKNIVPEDEVERFVDRFRGQEECERAEIRKIHRKPRDHERRATCYAVLEMKSANAVRYKAFHVYASGNCPVADRDSPHLRYLFSVSADEIRQNLSFLDADTVPRTICG
jgi:hypothetical protein